MDLKNCMYWTFWRWVGLVGYPNVIEWRATHRGGPNTLDCMPLSESKDCLILLLSSLIFHLLAGPYGSMSLQEAAVGVTFEKRQLYVRNLVPGQPLLLLREPSNPHDPNAVAILDTFDNHLGYLPRGIARVLAPLFRQSRSLPARVKSVGRSLVWGPYGFTLTFDLPDREEGTDNAKARKRPYGRISA